MKKYFVTHRIIEGEHFKVGQLVLCHDWMEKYLSMSPEKDKVATIDSIESFDGFTSVKFLDGSFGLCDHWDYVEMVLSCENDIIGTISPYAKWVKIGDEFDENEVCLTYIAEIEKKFRNGEKKHNLTFDYKPTNEDIEEEAKHWAEHINSAGWGHGYTIYWPNVDELKPGPVKVKCDKCDTFH